MRVTVPKGSMRPPIHPSEGDPTAERGVVMRLEQLGDKASDRLLARGKVGRTVSYATGLADRQHRLAGERGRRPVAGMNQSEAAFFLGAVAG